MALQEMFAAQPNSPATELTAAITDVQTTVSVLDAAKLPDAPNIATIGVDESAETVRYEGKSGNDLTGVTRGFSGTMAKAWGVGVGVARYFTAYDADALRENVADVNTLLADTAEVTSQSTTPGHAWSTSVEQVKTNRNGESRLYLTRPLAYNKKIVVLGSSSAEGYAATALNGWVTQLNTYLQPRGYTVYNRGISGDNTPGALARFYSDVVPLQPDICIIALTLGNESDNPGGTGGDYEAGEK
jgi:hypothetical protein